MRSDKRELTTWGWWQRSHFINTFLPPFTSPLSHFTPPQTPNLNIPFFLLLFLPTLSHSLSFSFSVFVFPLYLTRFHIFAQSCFYGSHIIYDLCFFGVYWQRIKIFRDFIILCSCVLTFRFPPPPPTSFFSTLFLECWRWKERRPKNYLHIKAKTAKRVPSPFFMHIRSFVSRGTWHKIRSSFNNDLPYAFVSG